MPGFRNLNGIRELEFILFLVVAEPGANQCLQAAFLGDAGDEFITLGTGKRTYPVYVRLNDAESFAYLICAKLRARPLAFDVGAERQAVNLCLQNLTDERT